MYLQTEGWLRSGLVRGQHSCPQLQPFKLRQCTVACDAALGQRENVRPADHGSSPFRELAVADIWEGVGRTRVRQHVNPLARQHQVVTGPPDWPSLYAQPQAPLVVDLGCGPGRFLLLMHHRHMGGRLPDSLRLGPGPVNFLGIEIRKPLVERANEWGARLGCSKQIHYVAGNATISLKSMLSTYAGPVQVVAIQFPDPHFKRRHFKRRIFQPQSVKDIADILKPGGMLFLQTDVLDVAVAMRNIFEKYAGEHFELSEMHTPATTFLEEPGPSILEVQLDETTTSAEEVSASEDPTGDDSDGDDDDYLRMTSVWAQQGWLNDNPLGAPTEREWYVMQQGLPVYRLLLVRK